MFPTRKGLQYYEDLFREEKKNGMTMMITISHYETP